MRNADHGDTGDEADTIVSPTIHSRRFAATVPGAKLIVLPGVGHMVQNAAPDRVMAEVEAMIGKRIHERGAKAR